MSAVNFGERLNITELLKQLNTDYYLFLSSKCITDISEEVYKWTFTYSLLRRNLNILLELDNQQHLYSELPKLILRLHQLDSYNDFLRDMQTITELIKKRLSFVVVLNNCILQLKSEFEQTYQKCKKMNEMIDKFIRVNLTIKDDDIIFQLYEYNKEFIYMYETIYISDFDKDDSLKTPNKTLSNKYFIFYKYVLEDKLLDGNLTSFSRFEFRYVDRFIELYKNLFDSSQIILNDSFLERVRKWKRNITLFVKLNDFITQFYKNHKEEIDNQFEIYRKQLIGMLDDIHKFIAN